MLWRKWALVLLLPLFACMEPCERRIVSCSQSVIDRFGYCPGVDIARNDGWQCSQAAGSLQRAEWSCDRCP